jgi:hypothetical protein
VVKVTKVKSAPGLVGHGVGDETKTAKLGRLVLKAEEAGEAVGAIGGCGALEVAPVDLAVFPILQVPEQFFDLILPAFLKDSRLNPEAPRDRCFVGSVLVEQVVDLFKIMANSVKAPCNGAWRLMGGSLVNTAGRLLSSIWSVSMSMGESVRPTTWAIQSASRTSLNALVPSMARAMARPTSATLIRPDVPMTKATYDFYDTWFINWTILSVSIRDKVF